MKITYTEELKPENKVEAGQFRQTHDGDLLLIVKRFGDLLTSEPNMYEVVFLSPKENAVEPIMNSANPKTTEEIAKEYPIVLNAELFIGKPEESGW